MRVICSWYVLLRFAFSQFLSDELEEVYRHAWKVKKKGEKTIAAETKTDELLTSIVAAIDALYPDLHLRLRDARPNRKPESRGACVALHRISGSQQPQQSV